MDMTARCAAQDTVAASLLSRSSLQDETNAPAFSFDMVCLDAGGNERWRETIHNTVTTAGKNDLLNKYFIGSGYTAAWFLGLLGPVSGSVTIANNDTLASHPGWTELAPYSGNRPAVTFGTTSAGSNTSSPVSFAITATALIYGGFLTPAASGNSGILYNAALCQNPRQVYSGDTLLLTATVAFS